jgi:head-tail adaptor
MANWLDNVSTDFLSILTSMGDGTDISLQSPSYVTTSDGDQTITYSTESTLKGVVQMRNAQERDQDERLQGRLFYWVYCDTVIDVKTDWRILYGSLALNIEEVYPLSAGLTVREFRCTEVLSYESFIIDRIEEDGTTRLQEDGITRITEGG